MVLLTYVPLGGFHLLFELGLHGFEVEARALLHRRILEESLRRVGDLLLHEYEAPELVCPSVRSKDGLAKARALKWIKTEIHQDRPVARAEAT